ncbi:conserved hypothetical protein [Vibrio crassostreae]|uniref:Uncharacterized protein n=2 Tax=Vibrio TaxID=662 RepID=A0A4R3P1B7_9VIBR|nr:MULTISPECIES: hypothetical protein [Vibrio]MDH5919780.1 hypothetical protein [Vibrio splendidus]MDH5936561.1 hypothetical protein [Vibrio splendidus]MDH5951325.1 hypothetical protein [Vibrio crassostreae]TCN05583.1 hypothetical protein EDB35_11680 [Vibrio crassostreae]TCT46223.1 hypothetical protein EDB39_11496 [Vibrio crassostreae]
MRGVNLSNAIAALRFRVRARRSGDADQRAQAELGVKAQEPFCSQVQQALIGNREGMTLNKVTPGWVKEQLASKVKVS